MLHVYDQDKTPMVNHTHSLAALSGIVNENLCHNCGTCIGLCPAGVLEVSGGGNRFVSLNTGCIDCGTCVKVCPGARFNEQECSDRLWGINDERTHPVGRVMQGWLGYAARTSVRCRGASGGVVTGLLLSLLAEGRIDGAVVVGQDTKVPWRSAARLVRKPEEILAAANSRYATAPTGAVFSEILKTPGRYAFVGLPCQLHGFHNACRVNKTIRERVKMVIGLFCHAAVEQEAFHLLWEWWGEDKKKVEGFQYRQGKPAGDVVVNFTNNTSRPFLFSAKSGYRPNIIELMNVLYRLYSQPRCMTCYDATALFADISVGDPWGIPAPTNIDYSEGYSCILARTVTGKEALDQAMKAGDLFCTSLNHTQMHMANQDMAHAKERRAFRLIGRLRARGRRTPEYGFDAQSLTPRQKLGADMDILFRSFSLHKFGRRGLLRMMLSPIGYWLFKLNHWRRQIKPWLRRHTTKSIRRMNRKTAFGFLLPHSFELESWQEAILSASSFF